MGQVIVYLEGDNVALISPAEGIGIHAIAAKDVPFGQPYKIIDTNDLPEGPQESWGFVEGELTDGVGADYGAGSDWGVLVLGIDGIPKFLQHGFTKEIKPYVAD